MVPSSCHGVVFAAGNGKCQEMLSLRIVVRPRSSASETPARSTSRSMSGRMVPGVTRSTATLDFIAFYSRSGRCGGATSAMECATLQEHETTKLTKDAKEFALVVFVCVVFFVVSASWVSFVLRNPGGPARGQ